MLFYGKKECYHIVKHNHFKTDVSARHLFKIRKPRILKWILLDAHSKFPIKPAEQKWTLYIQQGIPKQFGTHR